MKRQLTWQNFDPHNLMEGAIWQLTPVGGYSVSVVIIWGTKCNVLFKFCGWKMYLSSTVICCMANE